MHRRYLLRLLVFLVVGVAPLLAVGGVGAAPPANAAFERTWARTDKPVADLAVSRTWMWGPEANTDGMIEPYAEAPGGIRTVQYFDKSRMEDNAYRAGAPWDVTNGLLVVELMTGQMQVGDSAFVIRPPAQENVAGDADDPTGPTYVTFAGLRAAPPYADGATITQRVNRAGEVTNDPGLAGQGVTAAYHVSIPGINHQVASPFWTFMNSTGLVNENGANTTDALFENPFYATGYPVTEAYWANVKVGGTYRDVLMQCFERRCLTYTPGNPAGWQVEAGNVGQHYYRWRYSGAAQQTLSVTSAANTITTTASMGFVNIPGMSASIATTATGDLAMTVSAEGSVTGAESLYVQAVVDGTPASPSPVIMFRGGFSGTHAFTFTATGIGAGNHVVQLQWHTAPGETATLARRTLTVQATPASAASGAMAVSTSPPGLPLTTASTSFVPIPGASTAIQTSAGVNVSITFSAEAFTTGGGQMYLAAAVGGTQAAPAEVIFAHGDLDGSRSFTFTVAGVSGGMHTVQMYWRVDGGTTGNMRGRTVVAVASPPVAARGALAVATVSGTLVSTNSSDWADIPGLSTTINTPDDSDLAATVSAEAATTAGGLGDVRVLVDGASVSPSDAVFANRTLADYRGTQSFTFVVEHLAAGNHTVEVQARVNAGQTFAMNDRSLSVVAWPGQ